MDTMIRIIDYGMGNLRSVQKAFEKIGVAAEICDAPDDIRHADKLVLPGVGAFRDAIAALQRQSLVEPILEHVNAGRPILGICLGLQLLFDISYEDGDHPGLGVFPGSVKRFQEQPELKIPHMGWNQLEFTQPETPIFSGIPQGEWFYFVHSYHVVSNDDRVVAARTVHGGPFVSVVARDNVFATQFHPEKSQHAGLKLLSNFAAI